MIKANGNDPPRLAKLTTRPKYKPCCILKIFSWFCCHFKIYFGAVEILDCTNMTTDFLNFFYQEL